MASQAPAPPVPDRVSYADVGSRFVAFLLDGLCGFGLFVVASLSVRLLRVTGVWPLPQSPHNPGELWHRMGVGAKLVFMLGLMPLSSGLFYHILFETSGWQATLGKRALNIYVADSKGSRIGAARSCVRGWIKWITVPLFFGGVVSLITAAATRKRKALHDFLAGTEVLAGRPPQAGGIEMWRIVVAIVAPILGMVVNYLFLTRIASTVCGDAC